MAQPISPLEQRETPVLPIPVVPIKRWATGHEVRFYESEDYLVETVGSFLVEGVRGGQPLVIIATEPHREAFLAHLRAARIDPDELVSGRDIVVLDAREALTAFMEGDMPNAELFELTIGSVFQRIMSHGRHYVVTRAYGEMVDLLWKDGRIEGAIALERLWNDIATKYSFSLLCAYAMGNFLKESHRGDFARICGTHDTVVPTESYARAPEEERLMQIAILQQRAAALEAEIAHRQDVEAALRDVIAHRRRIEESLRRSEYELRDLLDNAPVAMHWVAADGVVIWANRTELALLGYAPSEYIGKHIGAFHLDPARVDDMLSRLARDETVRDFESTMIRKDGTTVRVLVSSNVRWKDGRFDHTRCFTRVVGSTPEQQ